MGGAGIDADEVLRIELIGKGIRNLSELECADIVSLASRYALWLPVDTYTRAPWLAPYAIRKLRHRTDERAPGPKRDLWGMPDEQGYFADDNSLIKGVVRNLGVSPPHGPYSESRIGKGLVCCHVWPATTSDPLLFSFVPNLVWLPKSLAPYSDAHLAGPPHEVHEVLKATSVLRYRSTPPEVGRARAGTAWARLAGATAEGSTDSYEFVPGKRIVSLVERRVQKMTEFLEATLDETVPLPGRFSKRYHAGVGRRIDHTVWPAQEAVTASARRQLLSELRSCVERSTGPRRSIAGAQSDRCV